MQKLNQYFMEEQNTNSIWEDAEKWVEFIWVICVFTLFAAAAIVNKKEFYLALV